MLKIAVIGNSFQEIQRFIEFKFRGRIKSTKRVMDEFTLENGDVLYPCYDQSVPSRYNAMIYDAFIIAPNYETLFDTIRRRTERMM